MDTDRETDGNGRVRLRFWHLAVVTILVGGIVFLFVWPYPPPESWAGYAIALATGALASSVGLVVGRGLFNLMHPFVSAPKWYLELAARVFIAFVSLVLATLAGLAVLMAFGAALGVGGGPWAASFVGRAALLSGVTGVVFGAGLGHSLTAARDELEREKAES